MGMQFDFDKEATKQKAEQDKKEIVQAKEAENQIFRRNIAYVGLAVIVVFLVLLIILRTKIANERRQKSLELERSRISRDLHDDLGSGLTKISLMSQVEGDVSAEGRGNTMQRINRESSEMVDQMNSIIWALNTRNDSLRNLITFIRKNTFAMFEDSIIKLKWNAPEKIPERFMNGEIRKNIYLVLKEALHNTLKYSEATEAEVIIELKNGKFNLSINDNGKGFDASIMTGKGNGLLNMKKRMDDIKGTLDIASEFGKGTKVSISCNME
jgi:signal transduction histidine kinase